MYTLIKIIITVVISLILSVAKPVTPGGFVLDSLKVEIEKNYYVANEKIYRQILFRLDSLKEDKNKNWRVYYYAGFIKIQLGKLNREKNENLAADLLNEAIADLETVNRINPFDESMALLSSAYGKLASLSILNALRYGSESGNFLNRARAIDNSVNKSKLNLVEATHLIFTPQAFGGDKKKAEQLLIESLSQDGTRSGDLLTWAEPAEIFAYLVQLHIENGNYHKAHYYCKEALKLEPQYNFILNELIPIIKKEMRN